MRKECSECNHLPVCKESLKNNLSETCPYHEPDHKSMGKVMKCRCEYLIRINNSFVPNHSRANESTTGSQHSDMVEVVQYKCVCCGTQYGYIPLNSKVVTIGE